MLEGVINMYFDTLSGEVVNFSKGELVLEVEVQQGVVFSVFQIIPQLKINKIDSRSATIKDLQWSNDTD